MTMTKPICVKSARPLALGKLDPGAFKRILAPLLKCSDPSVLTGPALGVDAAVVKLPKGNIAVTCDPITLAQDLLGYYAVHINANDLAVMGAKPAYMILCLLAPPVPEKTLSQICRTIARQAHKLKITVLGGHTEISTAVNQPVAIVTMIGPLISPRPIGPGPARPGQVIVMTKTAAIEATAIIARQKYQPLLRAGIAPARLNRARRFIYKPGISILPEARLAIKCGASAMHDATEGGMITALWELAQAGKCTALADLAAIPVNPLTTQLCHAVQIDPLRAISSGTLLITISRAKLEGLLKNLKAIGVKATPIGSLKPGKPKLLDQATGKSIAPCADQITTLFA